MKNIFMIPASGSLMECPLRRSIQLQNSYEATKRLLSI